MKNNRSHGLPSLRVPGPASEPESSSDSIRSESEKSCENVHTLNQKKTRKAIPPLMNVHVRFKCMYLIEENFRPEETNRQGTVHPTAKWLCGENNYGRITDVSKKDISPETRTPRSPGTVHLCLVRGLLTYLHTNKATQEYLLVNWRHIRTPPPSASRRRSCSTRDPRPPTTSARTSRTAPSCGCRRKEATQRLDMWGQTY